MEVLELLYKKHRDWCDIVESFGVNPDTAEDIVMEMYLRIAKYVKKGNDIMYDENEVNYYYIFRTLKHLHYDLFTKESKIKTIDISEMINHPKSDEYIDFNALYDKYNEEVNKLYFYDRKVFEIVEGGLDCMKLSRQTNTSYHRIYHTYRKIKKHLKNRFK